MWPDQRVVSFVIDNFLPARVHVREDSALFRKYGEQYGAQWTPTVLMLDPEGVERHRIEGFLPNDDFLAQLMLGRAQIDFAAERWQDAERGFRQIVEQLPDTDAAPEALYWAGVAPYKATHDSRSLRKTGEEFKHRYQDSAWAKKASVWTG